MSATGHGRPLFSRRVLRRLRLLATAGWVAGCANLIGLDDYSESDAPVRPENGGGGAAGSAGSGDAGDGGAVARTGGRPGTGGRAPSGGAPGATGGRAPSDGGEGAGPMDTGGRATGGRRGTGGARASGGVGNTGGAEPPSGGTAPTGGSTESGGTPPTTGGTAPTGGATGTGGAAVTSCALPGDSEGCRSCIDASCGAECNPCLADADCRALVACAQGCFSVSCLEGCFVAHPDSAFDFFDVYDSCAFTTCAATCGARFGASCSDDDDCASGTCSPSGFCTSLCDDHDDCPVEGWCAPDVDGIPRCLVDCSESESLCPTGHHCGYVSTINDYALPLCTPLAALSEPCRSDDECHSFWCTGYSSSKGWCSNFCVDNLSCAVDASCVPDSFGDPLCLLNCFDDADCSPYPDSECSLEVDLEDDDVDVCWL